MPRNRLAIAALLFIVAILAIARNLLRSSDSEGRIGLRGNVSFDEQPLPAGRVEFAPDSDTAGPAAVGVVENGRFTIAAVNGVLPGTYHVRIVLGRATKEQMMRDVKISSDNQPAGGTRRILVRTNFYMWPEPLTVPDNGEDIEFTFDIPREIHPSAD